MHIFGTVDQCCFVQARLSGTARGVRIGFGSGGESSDLGEDAIITDIKLSQREKVAIFSGFENANYLYAFGHDASSSSFDVTAVVSVCPESSALAGAVNRYQENRASKKGSLVTLSYGNLPMRGVLVGMTSGTIDTKLNLQSVVYHLVLLKSVGDK